MPESLEEARARLQTHFASGGSGQGSRWEALWEKGDFLPWDRGRPNPALEDLLTDSKDTIPGPVETGPGGSRERKKAFVPGCGRGYDVLLLGSFGYDALGLEVSASAVKRCFEEKEQHALSYPVRETSLGQGSVNFVAGDFFKDEWIENPDQGKYDLIYDYTFFCALPPSSRPAWAARMTELLAPKGRLICLEFPSAKDPKLGGPPYALPPPVYVMHLAQPGEEIPYLESGHIDENHNLPPNPKGLKRVAHWQPARTHEIGTGQDWISIWVHK